MDQEGFRLLVAALRATFGVLPYLQPRGHWGSVVFCMRQLRDHGPWNQIWWSLGEQRCNL